MASVLDDILNAVVAVVNSLSPPLEGVKTVERRALPDAYKETDKLPAVFVSGTVRGEDIKPETSEGGLLVIYTAQVVLCGQKTRKPASDESAWTGLRERLWRAFLPQTFAGLPKVYRVDIMPDAPLDRAKLNEDWAYASLGLRIYHSGMR